MKRSGQVPASLIIALASGLTAAGCSCGGNDECVDSMGNVVSDEYCESGYGGGYYIHHVSSGGFGGSGGGGSFFGG